MVSLTDAKARLTSLRRLPVGWDYGHGGPISGRAYAYARVLIDMIAGLGADDFDVLPGAGDGAVIVGYRGNKSAEISCSADGTYELLHEVDDADEQLHTDLSLEGLLCRLGEYGWKSPKFYASCTQNAMFQGSDDTVVMLSRIPAMAVACRWSAQPALKPAGRIRVTTSRNSMKSGSVETRQSSGEYRSLPWEKALA